MKRKLLLTLLLFSVTTALCACKGGTDKGDTPGDISSGTPAMGGEIVVGITQDLDSLDPHIAVAAGTDEVLFNIFEGHINLPDMSHNVFPNGVKIQSRQRECSFVRRLPSR